VLLLLGYPVLMGEGKFNGAPVLLDGRYPVLLGG
jgi:hypothetical protein